MNFLFWIINGLQKYSFSFDLQIVRGKIFFKMIFMFLFQLGKFFRYLLLCFSERRKI